MQNIPAAKMWHLSRGKQQRVVISDQELRLLARQGTLRADDLLWKRGFDGWRTAFSIPGLLTPPPLPECNLPSDEKDLVHADVMMSSASFGSTSHEVVMVIGDRELGTRAASSLRQLLSLGNRWLKWVSYSLRIVRCKVSRFAAHAADGSETLLSQVEHPRALACLLAAAVGVGTLDIAMQSSLADSATALPKYQDRPPEQEATSASLSTLKLGWRIFPEAAGSGSLVGYAFSSFQPTASEASIADAPVPVLQETAALDTVPRPIRKPKKAIVSSNDSGSERAYVAPKRLSQAQRRKNGQPKPMRFGTIGFNYAGPGM